MADERAGLCQRGRTCPRTADVEQTFGRGPRARVRRFCEPCAADARVMFGSDLTAERPLQSADEGDADDVERAARWDADHPGGVITPEERASIDGYEGQGL